MIKRRILPAKPKRNSDQSLTSTTALTFSDHIGELRRRVMWVALIFLAASSAAYSYRDVLMQVIMSPLEGEKLIYLTPGGGFSFILQITMYAGMLAAAPTLLYQLYKFIRPALPVHAQRSAPKVVVFAVLLMLGGVAYGYFVAIPSALHFLNTFAGENILPSLTADSYLSFFLAYIGGLGVLFMLPLILMFWHWVKPLGPGGLLKSERWVIVLAFVAAALITPTPDVVNQAMIAVPLILVYQLGVAAVIVSIMREKRKVRRAVPSVRAAKVAPYEQKKMPEILHMPQTPVPVAASTTALTAKLPAARVKTQTTRNIDGFMVRSTMRPAAVKRPPSRRLPVPEREYRPVRVSQPLDRRMSIDGMSLV